MAFYERHSGRTRVPRHFAEEAAACRATSGMKMKTKAGNCNRTRRLVTRQQSTEGWLEQHGVAVVEGWPTKGDDINPIENLWAILDERLEDKKFKTEKGMKKKIRHLWDELDSSLLHNLIESIPDRLRRIRKAKGGSIKAVK